MPDATALSRLLTSAGLPAPTVAEEPLGWILRISAEDAPAALRALCDDGYVMLVDLMGADTAAGEIELTWHVRSFAADADAFVKARVPYDAEVPSVWTIYAAALYPEREIAELFGMTFTGHPNPKRLLTSDESEPNLLRRSTPIRSREELLRPGIGGGGCR